MESKIISNFIKHTCSIVHFFQPERINCEETVISNTHISGLEQAKAGPREAAANTVDLPWLEKQEEREALAMQQSREEGYLSIHNQERDGIFFYGHSNQK